MIFPFHACYSGERFYPILACLVNFMSLASLNFEGYQDIMLFSRTCGKMGFAFLEFGSMAFFFSKKTTNLCCKSVFEMIGQGLSLLSFLLQSRESQPCW